MATAFFFRAVASDGKLAHRHASPPRPTRLVAARTAPPGADPGLRRPGAEEAAFELKLPAFQRGKRNDILFFTQELSTLLNAGVPARPRALRSPPN